ncbi:hypothetical protein D3C87_985850 [compost metagenome]
MYAISYVEPGVNPVMNSLVPFSSTAETISAGLDRLVKVIVIGKQDIPALRFALRYAVPPQLMGTRFESVLL